MNESHRSQAPRFSLPTGKGYHWEAYLNQSSLYEGILFDLRQTIYTRKLRILDYGCGNGASRRILEGLVHESQDELDLYDPNAIPTPTEHNIHIVDKMTVESGMRDSYDMISISYVLCLLEKEARIKLLRALLQYHSMSVLCVVDYTLKGMKKDALLSLLSSRQECDWRTSLGDEIFYSTHSSFTRDSLYQLFHDAGCDRRHIQNGSLDPNGWRGFVIVSPPCYKTKLTNLPST